MRCRPWRKATSARSATALRVLSVLLALAGPWIVPPAMAETFYRWTGKDGVVHYGDAPPKDARDATRIEVDPATTTIPAPVIREGVAPGEGEPAVPDILEQRRSTRARLEANLAQARERLALARKALAEATGMADADQQYTRRQVDPKSINPNQFDAGAANPDAPPTTLGSDTTQSIPARGGMLGMAPRANCRKAINPKGEPVLICPTGVPNTGYYERVARLEEAVHRAEQAVAEAEVAYRRGVD